MFITRSGAKLTKAAGTPSLDDVLLGMIRQPRFGGQCRQQWSVLDHSMFTAGLYASEYRDDADPAVELALLLHDAHEGITGDVPTAFKSSRLRETQQRLDSAILTHFPAPVRDRVTRARTQALVHAYDRRALLAEAVVVGPASIVDLSRDEFEAAFGSLPRPVDVELLVDSIQNLGLGRIETVVQLLDSQSAKDYREWVEHVVNRILADQVSASVAHLTLDAEQQF